MRSREKLFEIRSRIVAGSILCLASLLIMTGCGVQDPTSSTSRDAPEGKWITDIGGDDASLRGRVLSAVKVHAEVEINPTKGGQLVSGRHQLTVPAGALPWTVPFTMDYQTTGIVRVELGPHGSRFDVPVTLKINLNDTSALPSDDITLYWWNEDDGEWVDVGGVWDPSTMTLTTELDHFSIYQPGRAGW